MPFDAPQCCGDHRHVIIAALGYATRFTGFAAWYPYLFVWLTDIGLTTAQRGLAGTLFHCGRFFAQLTWGSLADWSQRHLAVYRFCVVCNCAALGSLPLLRHSVWAQTAMLFAVGITDYGSLNDALIVRSLNHVGHGPQLARARSLGSFMWAIASPAFGYLAEAHGVALLLYLSLPLMLLGVPLMHLLPVTAAYAAGVRTRAEAQAAADFGKEPAPQPGFWRRWLPLCTGGMAGRLFLFLMIGFQFGLAFSYAFIYFRQEGAPGVLLGLCLLLQSFIEVPIFLVADRIMVRCGMVNVLLACMLLIAARFAGYALVSNIWFVLIPEVTHGMVFSMVFVGMAHLAEEGTPYGLQASVMGLASCLRVCGQIISNSAWVPVVDAVGLRASFGVASAIFATVGSAFFVTAPLSILRARRKAPPGEPGFQPLDESAEMDLTLPAGEPFAELAEGPIAIAPIEP